MAGQDDGTTRTRTVEQIVAELEGLFEAAPDDAARATLVGSLQNSGARVLAELRKKVFGAGKAEGKKGATTAEAELVTARARIEELEGQVTELQSKAPNAEQLVQAERQKWERKLADAKKELDRLKGRVGVLSEAHLLDRFVEILKTPAEDGTYVDPEYAGEVLRAKYAPSLKKNDDGEVIDVLRPGEQTAYDGDSVEAKVKLLAADARKGLKSIFVRSSGEGGAGLTAGAGAAQGGSRSAATERTVEAAKLSTGRYDI